MSVYQCDPIHDPRWAQFIRNHHKSSVFHTVEWLRTLKETYRYEPVVFTTSPENEPLRNGIVVCRVQSWLTGRRLVSLPFSDHCEPLFDSFDNNEFAAVLDHVLQHLRQESYGSLSIRPISSLPVEILQKRSGIAAGEYCFHTIDLEPDLDTIYGSFDKDSIQRRIRRAERAGIMEKCGQSDELLKTFYCLFLETRRRQRVPPTPFSWFKNLARELGQSFEVRVAYKDQTALAAIICLQFGDIGYYKYGSSDYRFNQFGATPWLFWRAISSAKLKGARRFDLGRTEMTNTGLLVFKNHWDPNPKKLTYWEFLSGSQKRMSRPREGSWSKIMFSILPAHLQKWVGEFIYPHLG